MPYTTLGVIGHVDHGKTALVRALTGTETDRLREEKERGISITLGYAHLPLTTGSMGIIDAPGHEKFIRTMISGATGMRAVLLVIDVNEGVKPQTIEHLDIAKLLGVQEGVIVITKCDTADPDLQELVLEEIKELTAGTFMETAPIVPTSAITGQGLDDLRNALDQILQRCPPPEDIGLPYLPVDRVFTMTGFGTIVTGTLRGGAISLGDELEVYPSEFTAPVRELQSHNAHTDQALPGFRTAINLRGIEKGRISRGNVIAPPGSITTANIANVELHILQTAPAPLKNRQAIRLLFGTTETFARIHMLDRDQLLPGDTTVLQLRIEEALPILNFEPFIIRTYSPMTTIGGGKFLGAATKGYRRRDTESLHRLQVLAQGTTQDRIIEAVRAAGAAGITAEDLCRQARIGRDTVSQHLESLPLTTVNQRILHTDIRDRLHEAIANTIANFHKTNPTQKGITREQLHAAIQETAPPPLLDALTQELAQKNLLAIEAGLIRTPDFTPEGALTQAQHALAQKIETAFEADGLTPPRVDDILNNNKEQTQIYRYLQDQGLLVSATVTTRNRSQNPAIAFHRRAIDKAKTDLQAAFSTQPFTASQAKKTLGISRKYLIPLLESMDRLNLTKRNGDHRTLQ